MCNPVSSEVSRSAVWEAVSQSSICPFGITNSVCHLELVHAKSKISILLLFLRYKIPQELFSYILAITFLVNFWYNTEKNKKHKPIFQICPDNFLLLKKMYGNIVLQKQKLKHKIKTHGKPKYKF